MVGQILGPGQTFTDQGAAFNDRGRLAQVQQRWKQFAGSQPNGSGQTGLLPNDAQKFAQQQTENTWAMNQLSDSPMDISVRAPQQAMRPSLVGLQQAFEAERGQDANDEAYYYQKERRAAGKR